MLALSLESSWWSSFGVTFAAINWSCPVWLEWNFTFLSAVSAGCLVCLFSVHYMFQLLYGYCAKKAFFARAEYAFTAF